MVDATKIVCARQTESAMSCTEPNQIEPSPTAYFNYFPTITENVSISTKLPSATIAIGPNNFTPLCYMHCVCAIERSFHIWQKVLAVPNNTG